MLLVKNKLIEKNCLFVCFADDKIGVGHLFRSQILAKGLKGYGWNNFLVGPNYSQKSNIKKDLFAKKIYFYTENQKKLITNLKKNILKIIESNRIKLIIIDSYLIDNKIQKSIKKHNIILKISNTKDNINFCDLILNYSYGNQEMNNNSKFLIGPKYCLIENKFKKKILAKEKKILITFGGSNSSLILEKIIKIVTKSLPNYKLFISTPSKKFFSILKNKYKKILTVILSKSLSKIINSKNFNFIISSAGHSLFEILHNNYPAVFIGIAKNQSQNINFLKKTNAAQAIYYKKEKINNTLSDLLKKYENDDGIFNIKKKYLVR